MADLLMKSSERTSNYLWQNFQSVLNWTFILVVICTVVLVEGDEQCGKYVCKHGECRNQTTNLCECFRGWTGPSCEACGGRLELTARNGTIHEGYGNYTLDTKCSWLINGPPGTTIRLRFQHFATECSWDHLYIFDGTSVFDPLIAVLSGLVIPENADKTIPEIVVQSGAAYLHFYSDAAYNMSGFNITYRMDACPLDCSTRGTCQPDFTCRCDSGTTGEGCEFEECLNSCSGHGDCTEIGSKRRCQCHSGWRGMGCSIPLQKGVWEPVDLVDAPAGRASHKAVVQNNFMWIVSGDSFHGHPFQELAKFDLHSHRWTIMYKKLPDSAWPDQRYGHSVVIHQDTIYMFGGLRGKNITSDLWSFNTTTLEWKLVKVTEAESDDDSRKNEVIAVVAHTAHVYGNTMLVMFGHSPVYGYMNTVQECNLVNFTWSITKTKGAIVQGGYGHASVMDPRTDLVYVHAGYHSRPTATYHLTDHLYSYNPRTKEWIILRSSGQPKYLHSMVIISGLVLVFGGNTHNDTSHSRGAKCFSSNFLAYDIDCATWYTLDSPHLQRDISRFGHVSEVHDGSMYVFGGFNGLMLNDMYKYTPGQCESYNTEQECRNAHPGVRCVWAKEGQRCLLPDQARHKISLKTMTEFENPMCPAHPTTKELSEICQDFLTCPSCVGNNYTCVWWKDKCMQSASVPENSVKAHTFEECHDKFEKESLECPLIHNCRACQASPECHFIENAKCVLGSSHEIPHASGDTESKLAERNPKGGSSGQVNSQGQQEDMQNKGQTPLTDAFAAQGYDSKCKVPCYVHTSCENCTQESCMWCSNQQRCVDSNSYVASFPYGQCMEWTTQKQKCPGTRCRDLQTCDQCQRNPSCGWCDDGTNTGLGQCMEGGATGPYDVTDDGAEPNPGLCAVNQWYFTKCPLCQCNGHSTCYPNTSSCMGCEDLTTGLQCESCEDGYYGQATNGGNCTACECNGQADMCHPKTGKCFCRTRGTTGDRCDVCDEPHHYVGNPKNGGTCYYSLQIDFQFTFNLSKEDDKYYTEIKFMNTPPTPDRDVDFSINCSGKAYLNITVKSASAPAERTLLEGRECNLFKKKFSYKDYHFGKEENTTFLVYVYDFQTPFLLQISFSQFPQIDLVHFFVTFFSCFLSLLIIAAVFWKVKQRYDIFRRGQRIIVEMERMASRPFSVVSMEIGNNNAPVALKKEPPDYRASRRKSKLTKPSPIALEPIHGHKAAVLSLIVRLPTGDEDYTPSGQSGLCIGSALVTLGNPRKQSVEHSKGDKLKHKKHMASGGPGGPENCI